MKDKNEATASLSNYKRGRIPWNMSEERELDNAYQKALITGIENKVEPSDKKRSPAQMKEWPILSDHVKYITSDGSKTFNN